MSLLTQPDSSPPIPLSLCPAAGAYVQWRARAIGEESSAAEAKLEKAGPYEGMTVRRAMATVLRVLKDVLGDDFCVDRLEMVCVDNLREDDDEEQLDKTIEGPGRKHRRDISRSDGQEQGSPTMSSQDSHGSSSSSSISSSSSRIGGSSGNGSGGTGASDREISSNGKVAATNGSPGAIPPMPRHFGLFRRVSKSEMEKLLVDEPAATQVSA